MSAPTTPQTDLATFRRVQSEVHAAMSEQDRRAYELARFEADARADLAELVYNARAEAGLTQTDLAERAGTRQAIISSIENGQQIPTVPMLLRIGAALGKQLQLSFI